MESRVLRKNPRKGDTVANPFIHVELNTSDPVKAKAFYSKLFEWQLGEMPNAAGEYTIIKVGKGTGGGIMKLMRSAPPLSSIPLLLRSR
jgi:predicted enzyme related to lactoylglutathione lyase